MRSISILFLISLGSSLPAQAIPNCPLPTRTVHNSQQASDLAWQALQAYQLSSLPKECLQLVVRPAKPATNSHFLVDVREKHKTPCAGDPATSPRIATLRISRAGELASDQGADEFAPLQCPTSKALG